MSSTPSLCNELKTKYDSIIFSKKEILSVFHDDIVRKNFDRTREKIEAIKQKVQELRESISTPDNVFLAELYKEETFQALAEVIKKIIASKNSFGTVMEESSYQEIKNIFHDLDTPLKLNDARYERFMKGLCKWYSELVPKKHLLGIKENDYTEVQTMGLLPVIHSVFLNQYLESDTVLNIKGELPEELSFAFGCFLERGRINVEKVRHGAGHGMKGGFLNIATHAGSNLGSEMTGGVINAKEAEDFVGSMMKGGVINVFTAKDYVGFRMKGGVINIDKCGNELGKEGEGGTILLNRFEALDSNQFQAQIVVNNGISFCEYSQKHRSYFEERTGPVAIHNREELMKFFEEKKGIGILLDNQVPFPAQGLKGGILVFHQLPEENIGEGMEDGLLILENPEISKKEVKKRLSPKRKGGLVMMRVLNPLDLPMTILKIVE